MKHLNICMLSVAIETLTKKMIFSGFNDDLLFPNLCNDEHETYVIA